jgi:hypothetical protein
MHNTMSEIHNIQRGVSAIRHNDTIILLLGWNLLRGVLRKAQTRKWGWDSSHPI